MIRFFWVILICFLSSSLAQSQEFKISGDYSKGFIHRHSPEMAHLIVAHPHIFQFSFYKKTYGGKIWHSRYNFPDIGATFLYIDYNNPVVGKSIAIIPNFSFYFNHPRQKWNGNFIIGMGPSYHSNPYDRVENNKNTVLSTHFSYSAIFKTTASIPIFGKFTFIPGISMVHFSNASMKKPNLGINIFSISAGISHTLGTEKEYIKSNSELPIDSKVNLLGVVSTGFNETKKIGTGSYPFFNFLLFLERPFNYWQKIGLGLEYIHTISIREEIKNDWALNGATPDFRRIAIVAGYEQLLSSISLIVQSGLYVYQPYKSFVPFFVRIGIRHPLSENLFIGLTLKSHYFKAEAAEWSVGYRL